MVFFGVRFRRAVVGSVTGCEPGGGVANENLPGPGFDDDDEAGGHSQEPSWPHPTPRIPRSFLGWMLWALLLTRNFLGSSVRQAKEGKTISQVRRAKPQQSHRGGLGVERLCFYIETDPKNAFL